MPTRTDSSESTGPGKRKGAKGRAHALAGVFERLAEQHGEIVALMKAFQKNPEDGDLWDELREELLSHERAELREVFPVLRQYEELAEMSDDHDDDAAEIEDLVLRLDEIDDPDETVAVFGELVDAMLRHTDDEEQHIFPKALEVLGEDEAQELEERYLETQREIAGQL
jgi:hemerythrin superfamily protein